MTFEVWTQQNLVGFLINYKKQIFLALYTHLNAHGGPWAKLFGIDIADPFLKSSKTLCITMCINV